MLLFVLLVMAPLAAEAGIWCGVEAGGSGMVADISGNVCAQIELGARMDIGALIEEEYGFYGTGSISMRVLAKQYSRFVEIPSYLEFSVGGGGFYMFDSFEVSADVSLMAARIGEDWEIGGELRICPRFGFAELDVIRYSVGIPVTVSYTGNTLRAGLGVSVRMEVY